MKTSDIYKHIDLLKKYSIVDRVERLYGVVYNDIMSNGYGKYMIKKREFMKDFNQWVVGCLDYNPSNFNLIKLIPNNSLVDVRVIQPCWQNCLTNEWEYDRHIWFVSIHGDMPITPNHPSKRTNAICKVALNVPICQDSIPLNRSTTVGVIIHGSPYLYASSFEHVIMHELVHYTINNILYDLYGVDFAYEESPDDEFTYADVDEFLCDIIPFALYQALDDGFEKRDDVVLYRFKDALFTKFNPISSKLYNNILALLLGTNAE